MTRETAKLIIANEPFIRAHAEGKTIQVFNTNNGSWYDNDSPSFNAQPEHYRIKAEPREFFVNIYPSGKLCIHPTREDANRMARAALFDCIKVREVID